MASMPPSDCPTGSAGGSTKASTRAEIDGALWTFETIEHARCLPEDVPRDLKRIVVSVDPSGTRGDEDQPVVLETRHRFSRRVPILGAPTGPRRDNISCGASEPFSVRLSLVAVLAASLGLWTPI